MIVPEAKIRRWAVILAGGFGARLQPLTRRLFGDSRPKQFCKLFGGRTLLGHTQNRLAPVIPQGRMMYVVVKAHASYYQEELAGVESSHVLVQPTAKGTTAAIAYSLARIAAIDPDAIAGFFPADHYFSDETAFSVAVDRAYGIAHRCGDKILLLGAQPERPEVEYGWIEPGASINSVSRDSAFRVNRFWEKPSLEVARGLLDLGCLWNTFIMLGRVRTFLDLLSQSVPGVFRAFQPRFDVDQVYHRLAPGDFSRQVLSALPDRLAVLRLDNVGWSDLGTPERVMAAVGSRLHGGKSRLGTAPLTAA
jgi:mannose-1-phosphate guanylyltransferase